MVPSDLIRRMNRDPFKAFRIHVSDGSTFDILEPRMVIVGETSAVLPSAFRTDGEGLRVARRWRTVALSHMVQLSDVEQK